MNKMKKTKIGRNDLCPCGSGKKYKKCCLPKIRLNKAKGNKSTRDLDFGEEEGREEKRCKICGGVLMPFWTWASRSFGDVLRDIRNNVLDPPRYWEEVVRTVERFDPPADAEEYLI